MPNKWEKLRTTYFRIKKARNLIETCAQDDGAKFIWYDAIDEILNITAKTNDMFGALNQGVLVPRIGFCKDTC